MGYCITESSNTRSFTATQTTRDESVDDREQQDRRKLRDAGVYWRLEGVWIKYLGAKAQIRSFPFFSLCQQIVNVKFHRRGSCLPLFHVSCPLRRVPQHTAPAFALLCFQVSSQMTTDAATRRRTRANFDTYHGGSDLSSAAHQPLLHARPACLLACLLSDVSDATWLAARTAMPVRSGDCAWRGDPVDPACALPAKLVSGRDRLRCPPRSVPLLVSVRAPSCGLDRRLRISISRRPEGRDNPPHRRPSGAQYLHLRPRWVVFAAHPNYAAQHTHTPRFRASLHYTARPRGSGDRHVTFGEREWVPPSSPSSDAKGQFPEPAVNTKHVGAINSAPRQCKQANKRASEQPLGAVRLRSLPDRSCLSHLGALSDSTGS